MINLFILDDDPTFHRMVELSISRSKAFKRVYHYYDGYELLHYIADNRDDSVNLPDVILVDIKMPALSGWGFMNNLKKMYDMGLAKQMALYIVSAFPADIEKAHEYDFVKEYIVKPITTLKLMGIANAHTPNYSSK